jgi:arabinogalactan endo-1,4-beta-galactosidase
MDLAVMDPALRIAWLQDHVWPHEAMLLRGFAAGVRSVTPEAEISTHLAGLLGTDFALAFWSTMRENGYLPEVIGTSYYPSNNVRSMDFNEFTEMLAAVQDTFERPVMVAEFGYPAEPMVPGTTFGRWTTSIPGYAQSDAGQARLLEDLAGWLLDHGGAGIRPWAPDLVDPGWRPMALFAGPAGDGTPCLARPSLDAISNALSNRVKEVSS